jgi:hypothetical protein
MRAPDDQVNKATQSAGDVHLIAGFTGASMHGCGAPRIARAQA